MAVGMPYLLAILRGAVLSEPHLLAQRANAQMESQGETPGEHHSHRAGMMLWEL